MNIPECTPLYVPLYEKSETKISEFLAAVHAEYNPLPTLFQRAVNSGTSNLPTLHNDERLLAYAYLKARRWDVKKALKMMRASVVFREKYKLDEFMPHPSPMSVRGYDERDVCSRIGLPLRTVNGEREKIFSTISQAMLMGLHYWDKSGIPVMYLQLGRLDVRNMVKKLKQVTPVGQKPDDVALSLMSFAVETAWNLCRYQSARLMAGELPGLSPQQGKINFVTIVVDAAGLGYDSIWRPAIDILQTIIREFQSYYADCIHRILVVNCPRMIMFAFDVIKGTFTDGVKEKISFIKPSDTPLALERVIGRERVPDFLGGECKCPHGCIEGFDAKSALHAEEDGNSDVLTEDILLKPGQKHEKAFEMVVGEDMVWEFSSTQGVDIRFSVLFYPKSDGVSVDPRKRRVKIDKKVKRTTREQPLVKESKLTEGADHFCAPQDGILQLIWDNSRAWKQEKPIQMRVYRVSAMLDTSSSASSIEEEITK